MTCERLGKVVDAEINVSLNALSTFSVCAVNRNDYDISNLSATLFGLTMESTFETSHGRTMSSRKCFKFLRS